MPLVPQLLIINFILLSRWEIRTHRKMPIFSDFSQCTAVFKVDSSPQRISESSGRHSWKHLASSLLNLLWRKDLREKCPPQITGLGQHSIIGGPEVRGQDGLLEISLINAVSIQPDLRWFGCVCMNWVRNILYSNMGYSFYSQYVLVPPIISGT